MKKKCKPVLLWLAVVIWLGALLFLSFQPGEETAETSGTLARLVLNILTMLGFKTRYSVVHGLLRTAAHVVVFLIFGFLLQAAIAETLRQTAGKKRNAAKGIWKADGLLMVVLAGTMIAVLSEVLKIYIPGRHLDWPDAGLNALGAWLGCGSMCVIERLCLKRKRA